MLEQFILIIHALAAVTIIGLILIQQGKGAEAGASFGAGGSQTVFGVQGGGNLLTQWTSILAVVFFATSLTLAYFAKQQSMASGDIIIEEPILEEVTAPVSDEVPVMDAAEAASDEIPAVDDAPAAVSGDEIPE